MTNIDIANGLVFKSLNVEKDTFDQRLLSQKKVFLLQELGVDIGYSYNWYIHGPYSPNLATYIYNTLDLLNSQDFSNYSVSETVQEKINLVNAFADSKPDSLSEPSWYELLASVLFIKKRWKPAVEDEFGTLVKYKPQFTREHFDSATLQLQKAGYGV